MVDDVPVCSGEDCRSQDYEMDEQWNKPRCAQCGYLPYKQKSDKIMEVTSLERR